MFLQTSMKTSEPVYHYNLTSTHTASSIILPGTLTACLKEKKARDVSAAGRGAVDCIVACSVLEATYSLKGSHKSPILDSARVHNTVGVITL